MSAGPLDPILIEQWRLADRVAHTTCANGIDVNGAIAAWLATEAAESGAVTISGTVVETYSIVDTYGRTSITIEDCVRVSGRPVVPVGE